MKRTRVFFFVAVLAAASAADDEIPFPVRKSTTASKDGASYVVEGRQLLKKGVAITCKQGIRIVGRGEDATLVVAGSLVIEGQVKQEVVIENVRIEPAAQFQGIRIEWAKISGGGIMVSAQGSASGKLSIENTTVTAPIRLAFNAGEIRLLHSEFRDQVALTGVPPKGKTSSTVGVNIIGCSGHTTGEELTCGFWSGLRVSRVPKVLIRGSWLSGGRYEFEDCAALKFDGNTVLAETSFRQTSAGGFLRTHVSKSDFYEGEVRFIAPKAAKSDTVVMDKCWFSNLRTPAEVLEKVVRDGRRDEASGVRVTLRKINVRPLGIGGTPVR